MGKALDMVGKRFGRLVVLERAGNAGPCAAWRCRCDCGNEIVTNGSCLRRGQTRSCGCLVEECVMDLTGQRFGMLTVLERAGHKRNRVAWRCRCDCGKETIVCALDLRSGDVKSCGCMKGSWIAKSKLKHGMAGTRLYRVWAGMKDRCLNKNEKEYHNYGERGIKVCDEWMEFEPFQKWALANGYSDKLTIDRIDVNGDYTPKNCRWATYKEQANNKRNNRFVEFNGRRQTIAQWAEEIGINWATLFERLSRHSVEEALTVPSKKSTIASELIGPTK